MTVVEPIRVPPWFQEEFPGANPAAAEVAANLVRTADAFLAEVDRRRRRIANLSAGAFQALAILEGADEPLGPQDISERLLISSASMTSLLDTLERRALVTRRPHPSDRRKVLIAITPKARRLVDRMLPIVHATSTEAFGAISATDSDRLIAALTSARSALANGPATPPAPAARRKSKRQAPR